MKKILLNIFIIFFFSCEKKIHEQVVEKFYDGRKKIVQKYIGELNKKHLIEKIELLYNGDTLSIEKPLEKKIMIRKYSIDGKVILSETNYKDGEKDGKWTWYYKG